MQKEIKGYNRIKRFDSLENDHFDATGVGELRLDQATSSKRGRLTDNRENDDIVKEDGKLRAFSHEDPKDGRKEIRSNERSSSQDENETWVTPRNAENSNTIWPASKHNDDFTKTSAFREVGKYGRSRGICVEGNALGEFPTASHGPPSQSSGSILSSNYSYLGNHLIPVSVVTKEGAFQTYNPPFSDTIKWHQSANMAAAAAAHYNPYAYHYPHHLSNKSKDSITLENERYMYMARWFSRANPNNSLAYRYAIRNGELPLPHNSTPAAVFPPHLDSATIDSNHFVSASRLPPSRGQQMISGSSVFKLSPASGVSAVFPLPASPAHTTFDVPSENWCAKCNASFRMTSDLVYHMRTHHKRGHNNDDDPEPDDGGNVAAAKRRRRDDKLRCNVCNETFRERHHLTRHMTSHINNP